MTTITERVTDRVIRHEPRDIGVSSATDVHVLRKLDISRDLPPPSADESTQTTPQERSKRCSRVEHQSAGSVVQERSAQLTKKNYDPSCEACSNWKRLTVEEVYGTMSKMCGKQNRGRGCSRTRGEGLHRVP